MNNPFPLTAGCLGLISGMAKDAYKSSSVGLGLFTVAIAYGLLAPAFIVDFCLVAPATILFGLFEGDPKRR
ncbi:hypothetical protein [Sphingobium sp. Leaf26]|uniref:hypothetical protein n=1 Tax=Sphingobium sp. Leaf26 TaxID=1735693 RepID=UPI0012E15C5E|nr:hypothetical protein [Sphingobium sp. Leaf26]